MKVDKAEGRDRKKQERDATKGAIKAKKNQAAERTASTRAITYDDAVRAEVTAVSTPKVPQTATGFYDATAVLGKKGAAEKGRKFPKEIRAKEIEARKPPGFQVKRNSAGPIQNQAELLVELMALEIKRLNPERTIPRDDRSIVAVSAEGLEVELKSLCDGERALIKRLLGFDGERRAVAFRSRTQTSAVETPNAPTPEGPTITPPLPEARHAAESKGKIGPERNSAMQDTERIYPVRSDGKGAAAEGGGGEEQQQEEKDKGQGQPPPPPG